jgi:hypothetical protein
VLWKLNLSDSGSPTDILTRKSGLLCLNVMLLTEASPILKDITTILPKPTL